MQTVNSVILSTDRLAQLQVQRHIPLDIENRNIYNATVIHSFIQEVEEYIYLNPMTVIVCESN